MTRKHFNARRGRRVGSAAVLSAICIFGAQPVEAHRSGNPTASLPAARVQERCSEAAVDVAGAQADDRRLVCAAANVALERLGRCSIVLQRPLRIRILDDVRHPRDGRSIFGFLDIAREIVLVTRYDNIPDLVRDTPYRVLRPVEFYKSLIVHEVVHGVMQQNLAHVPTSNASYEYPAYAIQLESLPYDERRKLLRATANGSESHKFVFNDLILAFDPFFFAARAYRHFEAAPNRCVRLVQILHGRMPFIRSSPFS